MTLTDLRAALGAMNPDAELVFQTEDGTIGGGYHVTEFKLSDVTSVDCGGRTDAWSEATLQLLDGAGGDRMRVEKFARILDQSLGALPGLGAAPLTVEFAPSNAGLRLFHPAAPKASGDRALVRLDQGRAVCKPARDFAASQRPAVRPGTMAARACC